MLSKQTKRKLILFFLPRIVWVLLWVLYLTSRRRFHFHEAMIHNNFVGAFWHGEFLMLPFLYRYLNTHQKAFKQRSKGFYLMASHHFDAELMVTLCRYFGFQILRGSSSRGGLKVLIESIQLLKNGCDIGMAPDGPKGPYHSIADGVVAMSQKTGVPIVPLRVKYSAYWELKTWDKFKIPKPFGTIDFYAIEGFSVDPKMPLQEAKEKLLAYMDSVDTIHKEV